MPLLSVLTIFIFNYKLINNNVILYNVELFKIKNLLY